MFKHPFKTSLLFGFPMLLIGIALMILGNKAENNLPEGFFTPVIAFEFIQSPAEVAAFFNVVSPNTYRIDFMLGNNIDYFFMFFYAAFLGFTGLGIIRETKMKILWLPVVLTIIIFLADLFENITMGSIISLHFQNQPISSSYFGNLNFFTWLKWGSIAAVIFMYSSYFIRQKWLGKSIAILAVINLFVAIAAFLHRSVLNEIMGLLTVLLFTLIFLHHARFKKVVDVNTIAGK
jgi:hypothetical protein